MSRLRDNLALGFFEMSKASTLTAIDGRAANSTEANEAYDRLIVTSRQYASTILTAVIMSTDEGVILDMVKAHDEEECAQKGEPSPWREDLVRQYITENGQKAHDEWVHDRVVAMRCALRAVGLA